MPKHKNMVVTRETTQLEINKIGPEDIEGLEDIAHLTGARVFVGPMKYALGSQFSKLWPSLENMPIRSSDIFVTSFPRSGTTWLQELVWLISNDLDFETATSSYINERFPMLELNMTIDQQIKAYFRKQLGNDEEKLKALDFMARPGPEILEEITSQRFIKTHLPLSLFPRDALNTAKVVYIARDPRDVMVSYFHTHLPTGKATDENFRKYFDFFLKDLGLYMPFFEHVREAWNLRNHPNMLFLFYEDLKKDLPKAAKKVCEFFDKHYDEEQLSRLYDHLHIENFKKNKFVDLKDLRDTGIWSEDKEHIRKGVSGGWREFFDDVQKERFDQWMTDNLQHSDLVFPAV